MPKIDVTKFMEQSGMRRARFGGYETEDVRAALQLLCDEYEKRLSRAESQLKKTVQENTALQQHCQALSAQNQRLSGQNAALAGSSETYSRQKEDLNARVAALQERNHSLNDQCAVLRLKNGSLQKEMEQLKERTEQAEAELRIKGRALDETRTTLEQNREKTMGEARAEADRIVEQAKSRAAAIEKNAQDAAAATGVAAREQAREQAQKLVDAAAAEANEIQNAHQLRLNNLRDEVKQMEAQRAALIQCLGLMSQRLADLKAEAESDDPIARAAAQDPSDRELESELPELHTVPTPKVRLNLDPETLARVVDEMRAQAAAEEQEPEKASEETPEETPAEEPETPKSVPAAEEEAPRPTGDPNHQTGPALTEVPGAIFSSPIVRPVENTRPDETPPAAAPRAPVMPVLEEDEEPDLTAPEEPQVPEQPAAPSDDKKTDSARRRKAVAALRALDRMLRHIEN